MPENPPGPAAIRPKSPLWRAGAVVGGRYRLRAPIGAGAMGEVWSADHMTLGTLVAVKLVDAESRDDAAETLARFELEARAAAQLKSPHVVSILDYGADGRVAFIAMEMLEGESLERRLARRGRLMPSEVAHVLREMARGVDRAHAAGVVHRDLKPPNVFLAIVDGAEIIKVLDFGIAKLLGAPRAAMLQTQAGFVVGTPAYMSPEQVLGKPIDHRSDLWQMAVIAFECLTGARPFDGDTLGQLFMSICSAPMPVPSATLMPGVTAAPPMLRAFDVWFARAANRDPALRFGSAAEMAEALGAIFAPGGVGESAIPTLSSAKAGSSAGLRIATGQNEVWSTGRLEPRPAARRAVPVAVLAGLLLAPATILAAGGVLWWRSPRLAATDASSSASVAASSAGPATTAPTPPPVATTRSAPSAAAITSTAAPAASSAAPAASSAAPAAKRAPVAPVGAPHPGHPGSKPPIDLGL